jgi:hypothetical protein
VGVEAYRQNKTQGLMRPFLLVCLLVLLLTPALAIIYSLAYKGTPPMEAHIPPQPICKTADCFPPRAQLKATSRTLVNSPNCPNGVCAGHDVNGPVTVNPPVNPNAGVTTYDCAGDQKWVGQTTEGAATTNINRDVEKGIAEKMAQLTNARDYRGLLSLCAEKMKSAPEWMTPYLFCGVAYLNTGQKEKAKDLLTVYETNKGPAYEGDANCKQLLDYLRKSLTVVATRP